MLSHKAGEGPTDTTVPLLLKLPFTTFLFSSTFFFFTLNGLQLAHRKSGKKSGRSQGMFIYKL